MSRPPHDAKFVHELRKTIKRLRTLARLLRYELGKSRYRQANDSLRQAAAHLAVERDAQVRLDTLEDLRKRHPEELDRAGIHLLAEALDEQRAHPGTLTGERELLEDIRAMRHRLRLWSELPLVREQLARGLDRIYRQGRDRHRRARAGRPDSAELHEWRKRVKNLYYALEIVGTPAKAQDIAHKAERLGDVLGKEHDLWMLSDYLEEHPDASGADLAARARLSKLIERRRQKLRKRAFKLGRRVYELEREDFLDLFER